MKDKFRRRFFLSMLLFWALWWLYSPAPPAANAQFFGGSGIGGSGTGTTNLVARWTSPTAIGNSSITDNNTVISTTLPRLLLATATDITSGLVGMAFNNGIAKFGGLTAGTCCVIFEVQSTAKFAVEFPPTYATMGSGNDPAPLIMFPTTYNLLLSPTAVLTTTDPNVKLLVVNGTPANPVIVAKGAASQSANLFEAQNSAGTVMGSTGPDGLHSAAGLVSKSTKFTISGPLPGCAAGTTVGGATAGTFVSGTTGACTVVITMNGATGLTAPNGWHCTASDRTTPANLYDQSASTTTTATLTGTTATGDVISFACVGY